MDEYSVLCFIDNAKGRDAEIVLPVSYALETYYNCKVEHLFIWDIYEIRLKNPDFVLLPNCRGHHMYVEIADYAKANGIKVLALESEGNFATDGSFDFWGYNYKKEVYQEWLTCWSERTRVYLKTLVDDQDKVVVTGGTGFDKYQYLQFTPREELLNKYKKGHFKKVIGYAGWAFGKLYGQHRYISFLRIFPDNPEKRFEWVEQQRLFVRDILRDVIENNPDILFILKRHPKEAFESDTTEGPNEMNELTEYPNVLYFRKEEDIHELIYIADLWLGYKTTTALEAWLLGKTTILLNDGHEYAKDNLYNGSVKTTNANDLQSLINKYYKNRELVSFNQEELKTFREQLIQDTIGFGDGLNHMRAASYFSKSLSRRNNQDKPKLNWRHIRLYYLMHIGKNFYNKHLFQKLPFFKKTIYVFENRGLPGFDELKSNYFQKIKMFHREKNINKNTFSS